MFNDMFRPNSLPGLRLGKRTTKALRSIPTLRLGKRGIPKMRLGKRSGMTVATRNIRVRINFGH